jgi:hypothetical protein
MLSIVALFVISIIFSIATSHDQMLYSTSSNSRALIELRDCLPPCATPIRQSLNSHMDKYKQNHHLPERKQSSWFPSSFSGIQCLIDLFHDSNYALKAGTSSFDDLTMHGSITFFDHHARRFTVAGWQLRS